MWFLLLACAELDADYDGFAAADDCDDANALVYPGAPEIPGNGVDDDCADGDAPYAFLGGWDVLEVSIDYMGYDLFVPGSVTGETTVGEDFSASMEIEGTVSEIFAGNEIPVTITLTGMASPVDGGPGRFIAYIEGDNYDEYMIMTLDCEQVGDSALCGGGLKAFDLSLATSVVLGR
jgi:hypothetical protein